MYNLWVLRPNLGNCLVPDGADKGLVHCEDDGAFNQTEVEISLLPLIFEQSKLFELFFGYWRYGFKTCTFAFGSEAS